MAKNLLKAGHELIVYRAGIKEMEDAGAISAHSPKEVAEKCRHYNHNASENSPQVKDVVLGKDGILEGLVPGTIFVDMSSIKPHSKP